MKKKIIMKLLRVFNNQNISSGDVPNLKIINEVGDRFVISQMIDHMDDDLGVIDLNNRIRQINNLYL